MRTTALLSVLLVLVFFALCCEGQTAGISLSLYGAFGVLGDPSSTTDTAQSTQSPTGSAFILSNIDTPDFTGWYTACAISFSNFPGFGTSVGIYGPVVAVGDVTDNSVILYYLTDFEDGMPTGTPPPVASTGQAPSGTVPPVPSGTVAPVPSGAMPSGAVSGTPPPQGSGAVSGSPPPQSSGAISGTPPPQSSGAVSGSPPPQGSGAVSGSPPPQASGAVSGSPPPQGSGAISGSPPPQASGAISGSPPPQGSGAVSGSPPPQGSGVMSGSPPPQSSGTVSQASPVASPAISASASPMLSPAISASASSSSAGPSPSGSPLSTVSVVKSASSSVATSGSNLASPPASPPPSGSAAASGSSSPPQSPPPSGSASAGPSESASAPQSPPPSASSSLAPSDSNLPSSPPSQSMTLTAAPSESNSGSAPPGPSSSPPPSGSGMASPPPSGSLAPTGSGASASPQPSGSVMKSPPPSSMKKMLASPEPVRKPIEPAHRQFARMEDNPPGDGPPGNPYQGYGGDPDKEGFEYWNQPTDGSWLENSVEFPPPGSDQICGLFNFTSNVGTQFNVRFVGYFPGNTDLDYESSTTAMRAACRLCKFGQKLVVGQQFVATTCSMPCRHSSTFGTDTECTLTCIFPLGTPEVAPRLALPTYGNVDLVLQDFSNQYSTGMAAYGSFLVVVGCRIEDRPTSYTNNIGGFFPTGQLCSLAVDGTVQDGDCSHIFDLVPEERINSCPTAVAVYGDDLQVGWIAVAFAEEEAVFIFAVDNTIKFSSNRLTHYQKIEQDSTHHAPRFGTSLSFSANDELFGGERPDRVLLSVGAYGDVANNTGATFIFQALRDFEDLDVFAETEGLEEKANFRFAVRQTSSPQLCSPSFPIASPLFFSLCTPSANRQQRAINDTTTETNSTQQMEPPGSEGPYYGYFTFFELTPAVMSSYNYPVQYEYGFVTALDFNSVALVTVDASSGSWDFVSYRECEDGDQWTDTMCESCPTGQYSSSISYDPCVLCPAGTFLPRRRSTSEEECIKCNRGEFCGAGATVPINQAQANAEVYAIDDPDPQASPQLHFETTFFYSVVPAAAIVGAILFCMCLPFAVDCCNRFKGWRSLKNFLRHVNLIDDKKDMISTFFTIWLVISIIFLIVFAVQFHAEVNDSLEVSLKTLDDVTDIGDEEDLFDIDVVPFQVSVAFIDLIDYVPCDEKAFVVTIDGCLYNYDECRPDIHFKQSRIMKTGVRVCNVTMGFPEGTELDRDARFTVSTRSDFKRFYTQMVWYKVSSLNNKHTRIGGNSYISGIVQPIPGHILRGEGEVNILTTITPLLDCTSNEVKWRNFLLITAEDRCVIEREQSLKSYSLLSNSTADADTPDFYIPTRSLEDLSGYSFSVVLEKGRYYELKKVGYYVTTAQIAILVILLIFGFWWGFLQLIKYLIDRFVDWFHRTWSGVVDM